MRELACMLDTAPDTVGGALADRLPGPGCAERGPRGGALPAPAAPAVSTRENAAPAAPRHDMPRERLRTAGAAALSDVELLAILLGFGLPGHDVFEVARTLLAQFGSLRAMLDAPHEEFEALRGIGPAKAAMLQAVTELARRALAQALDDKPLVDSPGAVEDYLRLLIGGRPHEVFVCLFLDARHRLIRSEESSRGSLTRMAVYPREIVRRALTLNAASLIVAHNHPSGAVQPSASDRRLTRVLRETLALVEVQLIDHLVIGTRETFSFARHGWS
ncbi:RadC family protein [Paraburkholderia nodosa]|uniref:RadC family protein n=1 Tax=Paraburkholderia nodosa TaxID=392320 RepID=UPI0004B0545C|nr:DNA repair protein RadC [Paraburkholderia nodosa]